MSTKKIVKAFIKSVETNRAEKLMGMTMDIGYFENRLKRLESIATEEDLRKQLEVENKKMSKNKRGEVKFDHRNQARVKEITEGIQSILQTKQQLDEGKATLAKLMDYIDFLQNVPKPILEKVEKASEIFDK